MDQNISLSRRNLLRGKAASAPPPIRPPGSIAESLFVDGCTACGDCAAICPQDIIFRGSGGYPEVDFRRGACTFCGQCIDVCLEDVLLHAVQPPWRLELRLEDNCLAQRQVVCQTCGDACDAEAIRFRPQIGIVAIPHIDEDSCTGCGACIAACPENALRAVAYG